MKTQSLKPITYFFILALFATQLLSTYKASAQQVNAPPGPIFSAITGGTYYLCQGATYTITVTPANFTDTHICSHSEFSYSNNNNYTIVGYPALKQIVISTSGLINVTVTVPFHNGCPATHTTDVVFTLISSTTSMSGLPLVCGTTPTNYVYKATTNTGATLLTWTNPVGFMSKVSSAADSAVYSTTGAGSGTIRVTGNGCPLGSASNDATISITCNTAGPAEPTVNNFSYSPMNCAGDVANITLNPTAGAWAYVWSSSNPEFQIQGGMVTASPSNSVYLNSYNTSGAITVYATNGCLSPARTMAINTNSESYCLSHHMDKPTTESTSEIADYKMYPNPANNQLTIEYPSSGASNQILTIYDMIGKKVASWELPASDNKISLNVSTLPAGLSVYTISTGDNILERGKIMIQH